MNEVVAGVIAAAIPLAGAFVGYLTVLRNRIKVSDESRTSMISLLMGLAQSNIITHGMRYIERGWVTTEELDDLRRYLYDPYHALGGNGTVERIWRAVERLPFQETVPIKEQIIQKIPIRESDETGLPNNATYEGEERRGRRKDNREDPSPE